MFIKKFANNRKDNPQILAPKICSIIFIFVFSQALWAQQKNCEDIVKSIEALNEELARRSLNESNTHIIGPGFLAQHFNRVYPPESGLHYTLLPETHPSNIYNYEYFYRLEIPRDTSSVKNNPDFIRLLSLVEHELGVKFFFYTNKKAHQGHAGFLPSENTILLPAEDILHPHSINKSLENSTPKGFHEVHHAINELLKKQGRPPLLHVTIRPNSFSDPKINPLTLSGNKEFFRDYRDGFIMEEVSAYNLSNQENAMRIFGNLNSHILKSIRSLITAVNMAPLHSIYENPPGHYSLAIEIPNTYERLKGTETLTIHFPLPKVNKDSKLGFLEKDSKTGLLNWSSKNALSLKDYILQRVDLMDALNQSYLNPATSESSNSG